MTKKAPAEITRPVFTRVPPEQHLRLEELARKNRVTVADYLRWLVDDAVSGKYKPSHLR